jgi:SPP1 gp7 family putative phage head morphogenesis protein
MSFYAPTYLEIAARRFRGKRLTKQFAPRSPIAVERSYERDLADIVKFIASLIDVYLVRELPRLVSAQNWMRPQAVKADAPSDDVKSIMKNIRIRVEEKYTEQELARIAMRRGLDVSEHNKETIGRNIKKVIGIDPLFADNSLNDELAAFSVSNVNLIESIPERALYDVQQKVFLGFQNGSRAEDIAEDIQKYIDPDSGNVRAKANLIARDQINKLNGQLTMLRQTDLGIERYTWRTMQDERVRDSHRVKEGKVYSWDKPPADTGHPGEDINCRCYAEPLLEDLLEPSE